MKKFSWILALLLALSLAFIGCPAPDEGGSKGGGGGGGGNDGGGDWSGTPDPNATAISVSFPEESIKKGPGQIAYFDDNSGYTYTYGGGGNSDGYEAATIRFKVDLGTQHLGDYGGFTLIWEGISGDVGLSPADPTYTKNLFVLASDDESALIPPMGENAERTKEIIVNTKYYEDNPTAKLYANAGVPALKGPGKFFVATPVARQQALTGEVWFSIYLPADGDSGSYSIQNFKLIPAAAYTWEGSFSEPYVPEGVTEGTKLIVKVAGANQNTTVTTGGGGTIVYALGDKAYTHTYGTGDNHNYGNAISRFKVNFGDFKDITDFSKVTLKWTGISGDASENKKLYLLASKNEADLTPWKGDDAIKALVVSESPGAGFWNGSGPAVNGTDPVDVTLNILSSDATLTGEVWFAIYAHATDGAYTIGDVEFVRGPIKVPAAATKLTVNLSDMLTVTPSGASINDTLPSGTFEDGKLTVTFKENDQRVNFKLTAKQTEILTNRTAGSPVYFEIVATIKEDGTGTSSGDSFRYHIGTPLTGLDWNGTYGGQRDPLNTILKGEQTFHANATKEGRLGYFILQHRNANTITIEISSITIAVFYSGAVTDDGGALDTTADDFFVAGNKLFTGWGGQGGKTGASFDMKNDAEYGNIIGYAFTADAATYTNIAVYYTLTKLTSGETTKPMKLTIKDEVVDSWGGDIGAGNNGYPQSDTDGSFTFTGAKSLFTKNSIAFQMNWGDAPHEDSADFNITITAVVFK